MTLSHRLTALPRPFDPDMGAEARARVAGLPRDLADLVAGAAGSAPYLYDLLRREADWLPGAFEDPSEALEAACAGLETLDTKALGPALRQAKRRHALLIALMDLGGLWPLEEVTGTLTRFADRACDLALKAALAPLIARGKLPGATEDDLADCAGMVVMAMGKMGAGELNYSSDIDLICLFDESRFDDADFHEARSAFIKATRTMSRTLSDATAHGYVFRTDLRLRPDPSVTPVTVSMEAAERYYESFGRTWERAAYIKARPAAGDLDAGARFLQTLTPFVWRKHLDFAAIEDAHNMRLAIREHKGLGGPITLPGHDMKLGRGGIREIEFFTQTRQLIAGGRDPSLRARGTVPALEALAEAGWVPPEIAVDLSDHYRFHRTVEHRIQMVRDAQTHCLPQTEEGLERIACLMGRARADLEAELHARLSAVHTSTEGFFAPQSGTTPDAEIVIDDSVVRRWLTFPALRSTRAKSALDRLRPVFEARLSEAARPEDALRALDGFLSGLPAGVQVLALFEANPHLIDLVLDVASSSPSLAEHLSQNAQVLDAVIGGDFFADWPGQAALEADLTDVLDRVGADYERVLDMTRRWAKEWHFRIGVHLLRGLICADRAGRYYADLARAVLRVIWPHVQQSFAARHGPPPGRGAVLLGMGALGAGAMNARSDLDLIVIYDAGEAETSDGPRPLPVRRYFARLTQALITALSAPMAEGRLYEVDMRLRPSGNQGPVATSWASFQQYQRTEAWTWEYLALTRAAVVAGPEALSEEVRGFIAARLADPREAAVLAADVLKMRVRIAAAKPSGGWLDIKTGPGRMQDIELLGQLGVLLGGGGTGLATGLANLLRRDVLTQPARDALADAHDLYWRVQQAGRLLAPDLRDERALGPSGVEALLRITEAPSLESLQKTLADSQRDAARVIDETLAAMVAGGQKGEGAS